MNSFFTFLLGLINPLKPLDEEDEEDCYSVMKEHDRDEEDEDPRGYKDRGAKEAPSKGQKVVIVGLQNQ